MKILSATLGLFRARVHHKEVHNGDDDNLLEVSHIRQEWQTVHLGIKHFCFG
jgi:hypothetical protein